MVDHVLRIISVTIFSLAALQSWRGNVRFTVYINEDASSDKLVPEGPASSLMI